MVIEEGMKAEGVFAEDGTTCDGDEVHMLTHLWSEGLATAYTRREAAAAH